MPKQGPWEICVGRKANVLAKFCVPHHKMSKNDLSAFLRALVIQYRTNDPEKMVGYYVNRRPGHPSRIPLEIKTVDKIDQRRMGYLCGNWDFYAYALQEYNEELVQEIKRILQATKDAFRGVSDETKRN